MLGKQFVQEDAHRGLIGVRLKALVLPPIPKRCCAADGLPQLRPHRHRRLHTVNNLFALPLGHCSNHREEQAPGGRTSVDSFLEGYEVRTVSAEDIGKLQKLLCVAREPGELRKNQAGNGSGLDVAQHALGFGMSHDGLAADGFEAVHAFDPPILGLGIRAGAFLVVLRAFATYLIFR